MAKSSKKDAKDATVETNVCLNRRATHDYAISDAIECGIVLVGTEVKSLRDGLGMLEDAYGQITNDELFLLGCEIPEYSAGNRMNHEPKRARKLLARKAEIRKLAVLTDQKGFTLVPLRLYFRGGRAKVEMAVGKGKQAFDKRQTLKHAEARREMDRAVVRKRKE